MVSIEIVVVNGNMKHAEVPFIELRCTAVQVPNNLLTCRMLAMMEPQCLDGKHC